MKTKCKATAPEHDFDAYGYRIVRTSADFKPKAITDKVPKRCIVGDAKGYAKRHNCTLSLEFVRNHIVDKHNAQALARGWRTWAIIDVDHEMIAACKAAAELDAAIEKVSFGWSTHASRDPDTQNILLSVGCCICFPGFAIDPAKPLSAKAVAEICRRAVLADNYFERPLL